jgi:predicted transcriptional regulator
MSSNIDTTNARRFIKAYNDIDNALRAQHNMKRSMSFADLIRKLVTVNHIVRKYEDDLIDYGRLRNAIIHQSNDEFIIAEPHDDVVEKMERIARLITTPPNALTTICGESVLTVEANVSVENVIRLMAEYSYSNIPVYNDGTLVGVANGQKVLESIGRQVLKKGNITEFLKKTAIVDVLKNESPFVQYEVMPAHATVDEVMDLYFKNRKLLAVLITKSGSMNEPPLGIITTTNVVEMNNILDNY